MNDVSNYLLSILSLRIQRQQLTREARAWKVRTLNSEHTHKPRIRLSPCFCHISIVIIVCVESIKKTLECQLSTESESTRGHVIQTGPVRAQKVTFSS